MHKLLILVLLALKGEAAEVLPLVPDDVRACLQVFDPKFEVTVDLNINPFYLRADLDGDRIADYVLFIGKPDWPKKKVEILICSSRRGPVTLSGEDSYSLNWEVLNARQMKKFDFWRHRKIRGEVVMILWEDSSKYIYWDGRTFAISPRIVDPMLKASGS